MKLSSLNAFVKRESASATEPYDPGDVPMDGEPPSEAPPPAQESAETPSHLQNQENLAQDEDLVSESGEPRGTEPITGQTKKRTKKEKNQETIESFEAYEKDLFKKIRKSLRCVHCSSTSLLNNGVGGDTNQMGARLIQVKCKHCTKRMRLRELILQANDLVTLQEYDQRLASNGAKKQKLAQPQKKIQNFFQSKENSDLLKSKPTTEPFVFQGASSSAVPSADKDESLAMKEVKFENAMLRKRINLMEEQLAELRSLLNQALGGPHPALRSQQIVKPAQKDASAEKREPKEARKVTEPATKEKKKEEKKSEKKEKETWAQVASKNRPTVNEDKRRVKIDSSIKRMAKKLSQPRSDPAEFERIHVKLYDTRSVKRAKNQRKINQLIRTFLKFIGIGKWTVNFSLIGNSLLELYVNSLHVCEIEDILKAKSIDYILNLDLLKKPEHSVSENFEEIVVRRLRFLYSRARLLNLKACILDGLPAAVQEQVKAPLAAVQDNILEDQEDIALADTEAPAETTDDVAAENTGMDMDAPEGAVHHA